MSIGYRYFQITDGKLLAETMTFIAERVQIAAVRDAYVETLGATDSYGNSQGITALEFEIAPLGWRPVKGERHIYRPPNTKEGRVIRDRLASFKVPGARDYHRLVTGDGFGYIGAGDGRGGFAIHLITFEQIGNDFVLRVPDVDSGKTFAPKGCKPLKTSEYWSLKEAAVGSEVPA